MAEQPIPDDIDSQCWRLIFQAALGVSNPISSIEASLRVEREVEAVSLHAIQHESKKPGCSPSSTARRKCPEDVQDP
ncbi:MAG: hypothetical protein L6R39_007787 [Caloplaca ligustica]|nr:MAG: hypothetical protein L6R39_007787 [Caloplaca ligustica]